MLYSHCVGGRAKDKRGDECTRTLLGQFTNTSYSEFSYSFWLVKYIMFMGVLDQTTITEMKVIFVIPGFNIDCPYRKCIIFFKKSAFYPTRRAQVQQGIAEEGIFRERNAEIVLDLCGIIFYHTPFDIVILK